MKQQISRLDFTDCGGRSGSTWILAGSGTPDRPERSGSTRANKTSAGYTETNQRHTASCFHGNSTSDINRAQPYQDGDSASPQASTQTRTSAWGSWRCVEPEELQPVKQQTFHLINNVLQSPLSSDSERPPTTYLRLRRVGGGAGQTAAQSGWRREQQQQHHTHIQPHLSTNHPGNQKPRLRWSEAANMGTLILLGPSAIM